MRNVKVKKLIATALTLTLTVGALWGCGGQQKEENTPDSVVSEEGSEVTKPEEEDKQELEPVTLRWAYKGEEGEGSADVIEAFNKKLAEVLPNTTVEIIYVSDYGNNWPLLLASGEKLDLAWAGYATPYEQDVKDGNILEISALVEEYAPNLVEEMEIWSQDYQSCTLDGGLYGIPSIQPTVKESQSFTYSSLIEPYLDLEALEAEFRSSAKLTSKMLDIVEEAIQAAIDAGAIEVGKTNWQIEEGAVRCAGCLGYLFVGAETYKMFFDPEDETPEPLYLWEIPEYQMMVERYAEWYDKGWVTETQVLGQMPDDAQRTFTFSWSWNANWGGCDEHGIKELNTEGDKQMMTNLPEEGYVGTSVFGSANSYQVVPYTSENPERAIMLLNLLHDEPGTIGNDLMNLLCYGFEKNSEEAEEYGWYNYTAEEIDGQQQVVMEEGVQSKHTITNWVVGNTFKIMHDGGALTTTATKEYALDFYTDVYPNLKKTALDGLAVDFSGLQDKTDAMTTVYNEFDSQFSTGCGGADKVDALFDKALSKLNEVGYTEVKAEVQSQFDAYIGK